MKKGQQAYEYHLPILAREVADTLIVNRDGIYVDATLGGGGHSAFLLNYLSDLGRIIGLDLDEDAIRHASSVLAGKTNVLILRVGYDQIDFVLDGEGIGQIDGILYDLGISSYQVDEERKGFSFMKEAPLDMRFDSYQKLTAEKVVNTYPEERLAQIIFQYGEERHARRIANKIVNARKLAPITTTRQLAALVESVVGGPHVIKSLARVFQAIRIEVNGELDRLQRSLDKVVPYLRPGGRIAVISYHSLEDRIVKNFFKSKSSDCICPPEVPVCTCNHKKVLKIVHRKPIVPSMEEVRLNPRARSARLRVAERLAE